MTTGAIIFMALSWTFVLSLTFWSYRKMLKGGPKPEELEAASEALQIEGGDEG